MQDGTELCIGKRFIQNTVDFNITLCEKCGFRFHIAFHI